MTGVENGDIVTFKYRPEIRYTMIPNGLKFMTIQDMTEAMI